MRTADERVRWLLASYYNDLDEARKLAASRGLPATALSNEAIRELLTEADDHYWSMVDERGHPFDRRPSWTLASDEFHRLICLPRVLRFASEGWCEVDDESFRELLVRNGGEIHSDEPSRGLMGEYVGTLAGELREVSYTFRGCKWLAYVAPHRSDVDQFADEWFVSAVQLDGATAARRLEEYREANRHKPKGKCVMLPHVAVVALTKLIGMNG